MLTSGLPCSLGSLPPTTKPLTGSRLAAGTLLVQLFSSFLLLLFFFSFISFLFTLSELLLDCGWRPASKTTITQYVENGSYQAK